MYSYIWFEYSIIFKWSMGSCDEFNICFIVSWFIVEDWCRDGLGDVVVVSSIEFFIFEG